MRGAALGRSTAALGVALVAMVAPAISATALAAASSDGSDVATGCRGVTVVVDPGLLGGEPVLGCDAGDGSRSGLDALDGAGFDVEGTARWGPAFVCRIDGRPAPDEDVELPDGSSLVETCADTPSTAAYWTLWVSEDGAGWTYATTGVADLELYPGDVLGLAFGGSAFGGSADGGAAPDSAPRTAPTDAIAAAGSTQGGGAGDGTATDGALTDDTAMTDTTITNTTLPVVVGAVVVLALVVASVVVARRRRG